MKLTVIGAGNMGGAIANGIVGSNTLSAGDVTVSNPFEEQLTAFAEKGMNTTLSNTQAVAAADVVILAVKPNIYPYVLKEISEMSQLDNKVFVTIAPGISIESVKQQLGFDAKVIRVMPNTPAMVGEGMTVMCYTSPVSDEEFAAVRKLFDSIGETEVLDEKLLNAVVAVSGSSPAYVYMMIEAMADAAVYDGIPRNVAYKLAAQSVLGSAKMVLETGTHPGALKDAVCSPGGTTIRAVQVLEEEGFRSSIIKAMLECNKKAMNM